MYHLSAINPFGREGILRSSVSRRESRAMKKAKANLQATTTTLLFIVLPLLFSKTTVAFSITRSSSSTLYLLIKPQRQQHNQPLITRRRREYHVMRTDGGPDTTDNNSKIGYEEDDTTTNIMNEKKIDNVKIIGICGGIGSGKSTACKLMVESLGCMTLIDADKLAHSVYEPGSTAAQEIIAEFGQEVVGLQPPHSSDEEGAESIVVEIDRKKLGSIVFSNPAAMTKLETIVWPHVRIKIEERIKVIMQQWQQQKSSDTNATIPNTTNNIIVVEAALLLETNWHDLFDGLWIIQSTCEVSKQRLIATRGMTEKEALIRIHAQDTRRGIGRRSSATNSSSSDDENDMKEDGIVTAIITNDGSLNNLEDALRRALYDPTSFKKERGDEVNSNFS